MNLEEQNTDLRARLATAEATIAAAEQTGSVLAQDNREITAALATAERERDEARDYCMCCYCGTRHKKDVNVMLEHFETCDKHPLHKAGKEIDRLQKEFDDLGPEMKKLLDELTDATMENQSLVASRDSALVQVEQLRRALENIDRFNFSQDGTLVQHKKGCWIDGGDVDQLLSTIPANTGLVWREWLPIETAPTDGTLFIAMRGLQVNPTKRGKYYDKWPHQEGGPTFKEEWDAVMRDQVMPWRPTHWIPMPEPPVELTATKESASA